MSITQQVTPNVLNGMLAAGWNGSEGKPGGDNELIKGIPGNALYTPTWDTADDDPPFGNAFNGNGHFNESWFHYGQLYTSDFNFQTYTGNNWLANYPAFKNLGSILGDQKKVIKLFGAGTNFPDNTGDKANTDNARGDDNANITLCAFSETAPAGTFPDSGTWTKHEWGQGVAIPSNATKVRFGAYVRVPVSDEFRAKNCSGIYIHQTESNSIANTMDTYVNAVVVKRSADSMSLVTGRQTQGLNSSQQWSGLNATPTGNRDNDVVDVQSITYVNSDDYRQFKKIEKQITLRPGSGRTLGFAMFFAENQSNLDESGTLTGSTQFYNPFVQFLDSSDNVLITKTSARLILKNTGTNGASVTINEFNFAYDGTDGMQFPDLIKTPRRIQYRFITGSGSVFDGEPTITGGTIDTGTLDGAALANLNISWDGTSDEIVITTSVRDS